MPKPYVEFDGAGPAGFHASSRGELVANAVRVYFASRSNVGRFDGAGDATAGGSWKPFEPPNAGSERAAESDALSASLKRDFFARLPAWKSSLRPGAASAATMVEPNLFTYSWRWRLAAPEPADAPAAVILWKAVPLYVAAARAAAGSTYRGRAIVE